jgi:hypothetical protein
VRRFKFELGGSYIYFFGDNLGGAIAAFIAHRANRVAEIMSITEEPLKEYERR